MFWFGHRSCIWKSCFLETSFLKIQQCYQQLHYLVVEWCQVLFQGKPGTSPDRMRHPLYYQSLQKWIGYTVGICGCLFAHLPLDICWNLFKQPYVATVIIFWQLDKKRLNRRFLLLSFFLVVASFKLDASPEGKPFDADTFVASLPSLFYCDHIWSITSPSATNKLPMPLRTYGKQPWYASY